MRKILVVLLTLLFVIGVPAVAFAAYNGGYGEPSTPAAPSFTPQLAPGGELDDNGAGNANSTGINQYDPTTGVDTPYTGVDKDVYGVIKSKNMLNNKFEGSVTAPGTNQRTHGAYQNNTNSCASCHQTHTGAAKDLLMKSSVYATCSACHDGTLGFYNVFSESTAGTFNGTMAGNASIHLADGTPLVMDAPGYRITDPSNPNRVQRDTFDCAGCHAPHGAYSDRLLHYSPNGMADIDIDKKGNKLVNKTVYSVATLPPCTAPGSTDPESSKYIVVKGINGSNAAVTNAKATTGLDIVVVAKKVYEGGVWSWKTDTNPWVAGFEHQNNNSNTYVLNFTQFYDNGVAITEDVDKNTKIDLDDRLNHMDTVYGNAYAVVKDGTLNISKADIALAYVVKLNVASEVSWGGVPITKIDTNSYDAPGLGVNISRYCGTCHTDYFTHSTRTLGAGMYRHSTDTDRFNCLKCHYAHGTDVTIMRDALDRNLADLKLVTSAQNATDYLLDKNPSSALKRYTNMAVCWKCHSGVTGKSSKLMNNTYYWDNYGTNPQGGLNGTKVETGWTND